MTDDQHPDGPGPPVALHASRTRSLAVVALGAVGAVVALISGMNGDLVAWPMFAVSIVFLVFGCLLVATNPRLELEATTMTAVGPFATRTYDLRHCGAFRLFRVASIGSRQSLVAFDYASPGQPVRKRRIPTFDYDAGELVAMLNEYRDGALRAP